jgi:Amt family ammonium transporter
MCTWLAISWLRAGKPSIIGAFTGAVAGLACVTPCAGFVPTWASFAIGLCAGSVCYLAVELRDRMKWDDALDVWAAHGVGGLLGSMLLGVFAYASVNAAGHDGLVAGNPSFFGKQVVAAVFVAAYAFVVTWVILKVLNLFEPIRVPDSVELAGLDTELEEDQAYILT